MRHGFCWQDNSVTQEEPLHQNYQRAIRRAGIMAKPTLLLFLMLATHASAEPYQCAELRRIIPACNCESRIVNGIEYSQQIIINCRNLQLKSIPNITNSSAHVIYEMTLVQNDIQTIPAAAFTGLKIQRLDLRNNRLTSFHNSSFQGLENDLMELYMGAERGANVPVPIDSLSALRSLTTLHLEYFKIPQDILDPGLLNRLTNLTSLTLSNMGLASIESLSLPSFLTNLTLVYQSLTSFPVDELRQLRQLQSLTITNTSISACYRQTFELNTKLRYLNLGYNRINTLAEECFQGITSSLQTLSLRNNPISSVSTLQEIKQLAVLSTLDLTETALSDLTAEPAFLLNKNSLTALYLGGNDLTTLQANVFSSLKSLQQLHLADNRLSSLHDQVFANLSSLTYLDLSHQKLASGASLNMPSSLSSVTKLTTLKLSENTVSPAKLWPRIGTITSLTVLLLDSLSLVSVPDYALSNLTQLQELSMNGNFLTEINQVMLAGLRKLQRLTMNRNNITKVSRCAFYGFYFVPLYIELGSNPLNCDCRLRWLLEKRDENKIHLSETAQCVTPPEKNGRWLVNFNPSDFVCATPPPDESCLELYTTSEPPPSTTPTPNPIRNVTVTNTTATSITISWTSVPNITPQCLEIWLKNLDNPLDTKHETICANKTSYEATRLKSNTPYSICVSVTGHTPVCTYKKTPSDGSAADQKINKSTEIGIIVGTIVGALVLAAIIAAILYLLVCKKNHSGAVISQPHVFTPKELPAMTPESKQFTKPKDKPAPKVGRALDEINVTVISDGQTPLNNSRHSSGSYQFLDKNHPNPNPNIMPNDAHVYQNNVESKALSPTPDMPPPGYWNMDRSSNTHNMVYNKSKQSNL